MIIDYYRSLLTIDKKVYQVDSCIINFLGDEHGFHSLRILSKRAEYRQEVAVSESTLFDIIRLNTISEKIYRVIDLASAFPPIILVFLYIHFIYVRVIQRAQFRWEIRISPLLSYIDDSSDICLKLTYLVSLFLKNHLRLTVCEFNLWFWPLSARLTAAKIATHLFFKISKKELYFPAI